MAYTEKLVDDQVRLMIDSPPKVRFMSGSAKAQLTNQKKEEPAANDEFGGW